MLEKESPLLATTPHPSLAKLHQWSEAVSVYDEGDTFR